MNTDFIFQIVWILFFVVFMFFGQKIQAYQLSIWLERFLFRLKNIRNKMFEIVIKYVESTGHGEDVRKKIEDLFLDYVIVVPNNLDPAGVVNKIEHVFDVERHHWEQMVKDLAPEATDIQRKNMEDVLQGMYGINFLYKMARDFFLQAKKTNSFIFMIQAQILLPQIFEFMKTYCDAIKSFMTGCPIGDGVGSAVAARMIGKAKVTEVAKETIMAVVPFKKRILHVVKADGPAGTVGRPDEAVCKVVKSRNVKIVLMIDAGLMNEGDKSGDIIVGVGAAIGGFGNERFRIEEAVTKYKIPIYCWVIKESLNDAITAMRKEIIDAVEPTVEKIKRFILKETNEGDEIIVVGVGNTIGVGNGR